jgi:hypothetical protein
MICDSQDLALHTVMSDGVATVRQTLGGANKRRTLALWQLPSTIANSDGGGLLWKQDSIHCSANMNPGG